MRILWIFTIVAVFGVAAPAKILSVLPVHVKSHSILFDRLLKELAQRGHEITFITPFESKENTKNIKEIIIPDFRDYFWGGKDANTLKQARTMPSFMIGLMIPYLGPKLSDIILNTPEVKKALESEKFDLVFGEAYMDEAILAGAAAKNNAILVSLSTFIPNFWPNYAVGNPAPSSYVPDTLLAFPSEMTYCQRLINLAHTSFLELMQRLTMFMHDRVMRRHFGNDLPYIDNIWRNTSLLLVNNHPALSFPRPQLPNTIDIAGMHIYPPKPLPKDLEEYMSSAKNGVILFSLGTNVRSSDLPPETIQGILRAFGRMKENVLWKFEVDLPNTPENVRIAKWLPQSDILAHPNLKLFITHGGLLSTTEAIFRGVPIVGIPVMADQPINMKNTENAGLGVTLDLDQLTEDSLYNAAMEIITQPRYRQTAQLKSKLVNDNPMAPLDLAVWWIEYVLRNEGAPHLRSAGQSLWWFQLYQLDTLPVLLLLLFAVIAVNAYIAKKISQKLCRLVRRNKKQDADKKNN